VGFLRFAALSASASNDAMLATASKGGVTGPAVTTATPVGLASLAGLTFALATPLGWLSSYLALTGLIRCVAAAVGERRGDPVVSLVLRLATRARRDARARRERSEREILEGTAVGDRIVAADRVGITGAVLVVVASRRKPDWTPGTVLDCGSVYFRIGDPVERTLPTGLRTLYPLHEIAGAEVFRRVISYELPPRRDPL
jgi:nucleotide-binding universal stress UspA family protein